jgi:hypothetical protein
MNPDDDREHARQTRRGITEVTKGEVILGIAGFTQKAGLACLQVRQAALPS